VPTQVALELDMGRVLRADTVNPRELTWIGSVEVSAREVGRLPPNRLGAGERAVLAYAWADGDCVAGLDDAVARALAERMGIQVVRTIGVLLGGKRRGLLSCVALEMDRLRREGFRVSRGLHEEALRLAGEGAGD